MATRKRSTRGSVTGAITDLQRRVKYLQNKPNVTGLSDKVVVRSKIQARAVSTDQLELNAVKNQQIDVNAVKGENIEANEIGSREIATGGVENENLNTDAVTNDKIRPGFPYAVDNQRLSDAAIERRNMTPNSVENTSLTTDSVNFRTLDVNAVGNENMLGDSVGNDELQNDSVNQGNMQNDSVGFSEMQSSSVGNSTLQNGAVTDSKIGGTVSGGKIGSGFNGANINNDSIDGSKLRNNSVNSQKINSSAYSIFVTFGLEAGYGIDKRGNAIAVKTRDLDRRYSRENHRHVGTYRDPGFGSFESIPTGPPFYSSKRLKKDITSHSIEDPKKLLNLDFKKFKYKRKFIEEHKKANKEWMFGYVAEELEEMGFSEVIHYNKKGEPEKLDYGLFSALVLELVKVQQKEIELLQEKTKRLEEK